MYGAVIYAIFLAACLLLWRYHNKSSTNVPEVPGLPLLGNVIALGKGGVAFISHCRRRYGDTFCLRLLNQRMVFVFQPSHLTTFLKAPESEISFKPAVEQFTERVYGLPSSEFFALHEQLLTTLRQLLVPDKLQVMAEQLIQYAQPHLDTWKAKGRVELWSACQSLVFQCAGQVLFGSAFFKRHGMQEVQHTFLTFEENFEIAASPIPHLLLPQFRAARARLLAMFAESLDKKDFKGSVVEQLLDGCGMSPKYWPNLLLAVLWASQANSMPGLFWSLAMLLLPEQTAARQRIMQDMQQAVQQNHNQQQTCPAAAVTADGGQLVGSQLQQQDAVPQPLNQATATAMIRLAMDKRSFISCCVAEAIRLRLHSIAVRIVSADNLTLRVPSKRCRNSSSGGSLSSSSPGSTVDTSQHQPQRTVHIPRGTILAICPFESHHDTTLYPEHPWRYNPDRAGIQGLEPGTVVPGIAGLGFGGGYWRCPGRFFAEMELALLVQLLMTQMQLELTSEAVSRTARREGGASKPHGAAFGPAAAQGGRCAYGMLPGPFQKLLCGVISWVRDVAIFGAGLLGGSQESVLNWCGSGDLQQLLPQPNLLRLVGLKVPLGEWWVRVG